MLEIFLVTCKGEIEINLEHFLLLFVGGKSILSLMHTLQGKC